MNFWDYFYIVSMPLGWLTSILATWRLIQTKSARSWSITAYALALTLLSVSFTRALLSVQDFLFSLNFAVFLVLNSFQLACIWKWRKQ